MTSVLQLVRKLLVRPPEVSLAGYRLRPFDPAGDTELWLELRRKAFARQKIGVRDWTAADFSREFLTKPWWTPSAICFAETLDPAAQAVGTVALGWRGPAGALKPVIHWLAVLQRFRRHGIGRLLVANLERAAWDAGHREVFLETHVGWTEAVDFYRALGYVPAMPPP